MIKRAWIYFVATLVLLGLLSILLFFYVDHQARVMNEDLRISTYVAYKCVDECPYVNVAGSDVNSTHTNLECFEACKEFNSREAVERFKKIGDSLLIGWINKRSLGLYNSAPFTLVGECFNKAFRGDKSCSSEVLANSEVSLENFYIPEYQNVTMEFEELNCSNDKISVRLRLLEGRIENYSLFFSIKGEGMQATYPYSPFPSEGINVSKTLVVSSENIPGLEDTYKVGISYSIDGDLRSTYTSKLCE